jgi:hypothetical protein
MNAASFVEHGFVLVPDLLAKDECAAVSKELEAASSVSGGTRTLLRETWCQELTSLLRRRVPLVPQDFVAVQCTYFQKSTSQNWLVPIHQDLSIPVAARVEHASLTGWSDKEGTLFVQPPLSVLEALIAVRVHIDPCSLSDGPLRVVPGSHRLGRVQPESAADVRHRYGEIVCEAASGSALALRPLLLHSSSKSSGTGLRRVLHFLFGPAVLPLRLEWRDAV